MHRIIKYSIWLFELVTTAKSFRDNPIIGSPLLNRMGLHVVRIIISHGIMRMRMWVFALPLSAKDRNAYFRNGFILKENFLPQEQFIALKAEVYRFDGEIREAHQGDTLTHRAELSPDTIASYPQLQLFLQHKKLGRLARFTAGHARAPLYYIEKVKNRYSQGGEDPQKHLHTDTFHPTMKCWYFLEDVTADKGPFNYVIGSQRLTWKLLKWHYNMSIHAKDSANVLHARGSIRYTQNDLNDLGLEAPHAFIVPKNTLVLANVFGIHKRGDGGQQSTRLALWGDSRTNPFLPFPGIGGAFVNYWQYYFLARYRKRCDINAAKKGRASPWRILSDEEKKDAFS